MVLGLLAGFNRVCKNGQDNGNYFYVVDDMVEVVGIHSSFPTDLLTTSEFRLRYLS